MFQSDDWASRAPAGADQVRALAQVKKELLTELGGEFYRSYLEGMRVIGEINGKLYLSARTDYARDRIRERALARLEARFRVYAPECGEIELRSERDLPDEVLDALAGREPPNGGGGGVADAAAPAPQHPLSYTFETFCLDPTNFRALTVAQMIATGAGMAFPVTVIYGPPGCGKTHLLNAIKHHLEHSTSRTALLMWAQEFLEQFQSALQRKHSSAFKDFVRQPDVLLIDDIQRIFGKKATEEEALATIAMATQQGRQVILTCDTNADGMSGLDERLRRVLKGATECEITEPGKELRRKILEQRVTHYARHVPGFTVAPDALDMIADRLVVSGRELDGAVGQLVVETQVNGGLDVTMDVAETALRGKLANLAAEKRVTIQLVQKVVAAHYGMTVDELLSRTRQQNIARPRQIAMFLALKLAKRSLPFTGDKFGGFDHTTVMFARNKIARMVEEDAAFKAEIEEIIRKVRRENQD